MLAYRLFESAANVFEVCFIFFHTHIIPENAFKILYESHHPKVPESGYDSVLITNIRGCMNTFNTGKVQIGLLYKPKAAQFDKDSELLQRALLANGVRHINWDALTPWLSLAAFIVALLAQAAGVFE